MSDTFVTVERVGQVAVVRIDRPKANALSAELLNQLTAACEEIERDLPGAVLLWGGERVFSAGAEIHELSDKQSANALTESFAKALEVLARIPRVVIAAIAGVAVGGGCELALTCDFRFAARDARLGQPEILLGLIPGAGGTQRLARLCGIARAKDLVLTGRLIQAEEAERIGLVDRVVEPGLVYDEALAFASDLAAGPLIAHGLAKRAIQEGLDLSLRDGLALERELFAQVLDTDDAAIGVRSFLDEGPGKARFGGS